MERATVQRSLARGWFLLRRAGGVRLHFLAVTTSLLLLHLLLVVLSGLQTAHQSVLARGVVSIDILPGTSDQQIQEQYAALHALPSVQDVTYVPREEILAEEQARDPSIETFLTQYGMENPFVDTFRVVPGTRMIFDDMRSFLQQGGDGMAIDPAATMAITDAEALTEEQLQRVDAVEQGVTLFVALASLLVIVTSLSYLSSLAAARREAATVEVLEGATPAMLFVPLATAGVLGLLLALTIATIGAEILLLILPSQDASQSISLWITQDFLAALLRRAPLVIAAEAVFLVIVACLVSRLRVAFRS